MSTSITVEQGVAAYMAYHRSNSRPNTIKSFDYTLSRFKEWFKGEDVTAVPDSRIVEFIESITSGGAAATKNNRAGHLSAFFNFVRDTFDIEFINPCSRGLIKKLYKRPRKTSPELLDKEIMDEIIYGAKGRDRLFLELMGRTGMRVGEVLAIKPCNLNYEVATITIEQPKSGRAGEVVYIPQKMMRRLDAYVRETRIRETDRIFPFSYTTAHRTVKRFGESVGVRLRPHDLRRHAATQASRSGMPLEIVSKVMLRHADLATTQIYLGSVSAAEASREIESLLG